MTALRLRFGGYQPARSVLTRGARRVGEELTRRLGTDVAFDMQENVTAAGRKAADLLAMTESGELDLCYFSSSYLTARVPALTLFDLPFQFDSRSQAYAAIDRVGGHLADAVAAATGYRVLGFWDNGIRHISNARHPIVTPADCRGLTIRTLDNALHQRVFTALGFKPVTIDVKDLAAAVQEHRVDAQENPLTNLINFQLYKTHRFVTLTGHFFGVALVLCNKQRFDSWPTDVQTALREAAATATIIQRQEATREDDVCLKELLADGVTITRADEFDRPAFVAAVADVRAAAIAQAGGALI
jgi:TRAP-type C4-dicarboxylate transport system substrate-binding protein